MDERIAYQMETANMLKLMEILTATGSTPVRDKMIAHLTVLVSQRLGLSGERSGNDLP